MTDENTQDPSLDEAPQKTELELLKERATTMGIPFRDNIKDVDKLKAKINAKLSGEDDGEDEEDEDSADADARPETVAERRTRIRAEMRKEKLKLIRCRVYNLDPSKNDLEGEIFTVSNNILGAVRKMIPYGDKSENGYHIPQILLDELKRRKFQQVKTRKVDGQIVVSKRQVPEFNIEILPPLTKEELHNLAQRQAAAERLAGSGDR